MSCEYKMHKMLLSVGVWLVLGVIITACSSSSSLQPKSPRVPSRPELSSLNADGAGREILMMVMGLLDIDYRFGGKHPEAGLDCSGMVSYIYRHAVGLALPSNAAQIARLARPVGTERLRVGDLVFFNTMNRTYSHIGIYIGKGKFAHAPRTNSKIRVDRMDNPYFASRFDGARTLFD